MLSMFSCTKEEKRKLSLREQGIAINYAMQLELNNYPEKTLQFLANKIKQCNTKDSKALLDFWKTNSTLTQRAYIGVLYYM